jgi:dTDP-glucose pyrophosphorylase
MGMIDMAARLAAVRASPDATIAEALRQLETAGTGVLLLADETDRLLGVLTNGDIRRAILAGRSFDSPAREIATEAPVVAPAGLAPAEMLALMDRGREFLLDHLPVVDDAGCVTALHLRSDFVSAPVTSAVVMAGGLGTRLRPLTDATPKPMLPMGERPLLEITLERLGAAGIRNVSVTTHYLGDRISSYFGDGHQLGVDLQYVDEPNPQGTAGGLRGVVSDDGPVLVLNGDLLTGVSFSDLVAFHRTNRADATVGVRRVDVPVPYGVVECDGTRVRALREKPRVSCLINAGVYLLEPNVRELIPPTGRYDMTDLIQALLAAGRTVVSFPIVEYWMDIGQMADYERAQDDVRNERVEPCRSW